MRYFGKDATNQDLTQHLESTVQKTVQSARLEAEGIDPNKVQVRSQRVPFRRKRHRPRLAADRPSRAASIMAA